MYKITIEAHIPEEEIIGLKEQLEEQIGDINVVSVKEEDGFVIRVPCDRCGNYEELFYYDDEELCIECIKKSLESVR